jgi:hypothetical protein
MPSKTELQNAFDTSPLPRLGYTFERAMQSNALVICLNRLAQRKAKPLPEPKPVKHYWYQEN